MAGNGLDYKTKLELENLELRSKIEMLRRNVFSEDIEDIIPQENRDFWYVCIYEEGFNDKRKLKMIYPQFSYQYALQSFPKLLEEFLIITENQRCFCLELKVGHMTNSYNNYYSVTQMPSALNVYIKGDSVETITTADWTADYPEIIELADSIESPIRIYHHETTAEP